MEQALWSRRDRAQLVKDVLLALSQGSLSKTKLQNMVGLNRRLFDTYVENILVRYGFVEKKRIGRTTYYMLTRKGRAYMMAIVFSDIELLRAEEEFADEVAAILSKTRLRYTRNKIVATEAAPELPVDFAVETRRGTLHIYLAQTWVTAQAKYCVATVLHRLANVPVAVVAPEPGPGMAVGDGQVPVAYYRSGDARHAAETILRLASAAEKGQLGRMATVAEARVRERILL